MRGESGWKISHDRSLADFRIIHGHARHIGSTLDRLTSSLSCVGSLFLRTFVHQNFMQRAVRRLNVPLSQFEMKSQPYKVEMPKKKRRHDLEDWEVALVKAMLKKGDLKLAYFTRPTRTINHRVIGEIRKEIRRNTVVPATANDLNEFLVNWPRVDFSTGLSIDNDELLIKAREAMIAAVHIFNSAGLNFRAELFIVTAVIAWTYLMHAYFKREKIDYRHYKNTNGNKTVKSTNCGAERYWDLSRCLRANECPLEKGIKRNLEFLLEIRHEIEHRSTNRIDEAISAKLQACCLNFNNSIKKLFGQEYGLEKRLPIALQFVTFSSEQAGVIIGARHLPEHIETMINSMKV